MHQVKGRKKNYKVNLESYSQILKEARRIENLVRIDKQDPVQFANRYQNRFSITEEKSIKSLPDKTEFAYSSVAYNLQREAK